MQLFLPFWADTPPPIICSPLFGIIRNQQLIQRVAPLRAVLRCSIRQRPSPSAYRRGPVRCGAHGVDIAQRDSIFPPTHLGPASARAPLHPVRVGRRSEEWLESFSRALKFARAAWYTKKEAAAALKITMRMYHRCEAGLRWRGNHLGIWNFCDGAAVSAAGRLAQARRPGGAGPLFRISIERTGQTLGLRSRKAERPKSVL
jgi:hypothetical protein